MLRSIILALVSLLSTVTTHAQQDPRMTTFLAGRKQLGNIAAHEYLEALYPEWKFKRLLSLCMLVGSRTKEANPAGGITYMYQRRFYEAARVDPLKDSKEVIAQKIAAMWAVYEQSGLAGCSNAQFDITEGSVLKYAVITGFDNFIEDMIAWKANLNGVDGADDRTVLDYIQHHIKLNKGNALEPQLLHYYNKFRKAGAKHKSEL